MKRIVLFSFVALSGIRSFSQQPYFEGTLVYQVSVQSKADNLSEQDAEKVLAAGGTLTVICKNGNFWQKNPYEEAITIAKDKKVYVKFPKLDTLYYIDFPTDTSDLKEVRKTDSIFMVNGYACKAITLRTSNYTNRYYYTEMLRNNPALEMENTLGYHHVYARETGASVNLWERSEYALGIVTDSCIRIEQKSIDDHVFDLPVLPMKKFDPAELQSIPRFPGKDGAWLKYLQSNLDPNIAAKYVKLPKDQQQAQVIVQVEFIVGEDGSISDIQVVNKKDVHPKLAQEAMRVIQESPRWLPAQYYGQKIKR
jgi:Gram-negative bacterial TonB protein C-terminal